jgi:hypothetical protein
MEAFTLMMFQVEFFWVVTPCIVVVGNQRFGGSCYLHLQGEACRSEAVISYHNTKRHHDPEDLDMGHRESYTFTLHSTESRGSKMQCVV